MDLKAKSLRLVFNLNSIRVLERSLQNTEIFVVYEVFSYISRCCFPQVKIVLMFYRTHSGCAYFSETMQGLRTHASRQHKVEVNKTYIDEEASTVKLAILVTLYGKGKRLRVDRVTYNTAEPALKVNEETSKEPQLPSYNLLPPPSIESMKKQEAFFRTLWIELLSCWSFFQNYL